MNTVRFGVIGIGNMGTNHVKSLGGGLIEGASLNAICDINPARLDWARETFPGVALYDSAEKMIAEADIDAIVIAVPHYFHPVYAKLGFERGLNVLTEKPAGVFTKAVREMNAAAEKSGKVFGIMYNQRTNPVYATARKMIQNGELGELKRVIWEVTDWYRSQSYYNSSDWRATWAQEGGGVLLNQCPHQLDLWQWICGMPVEVTSFMRYGCNRNIEVENDVTTFVKYPNGATGLFIASTHDTPGTNRLEITGDLGKMVVEKTKITFYKNKIGEKEFNETFTNGFGEPEYEVIDIPIEGTDTGHNGILQNFTNAILYGTPLLAPGYDGIKGLSISNAMHLSDWTGNKTIEIASLDEDLFCELLQKHIDESTLKKETSESKTLSTEGTY